MTTKLNTQVKIRMRESEAKRATLAARKEKISRAEYIRRAVREALRSPRERRLEKTLFDAAGKLWEISAEISRIKTASAEPASLSQQDLLRLRALLQETRDEFSATKIAALELAGRLRA